MVFTGKFISFIYGVKSITIPWVVNYFTLILQFTRTFLIVLLTYIVGINIFNIFFIFVIPLFLYRSFVLSLTNAHLKTIVVVTALILGCLFKLMQLWCCKK